MRTSHSTSGHGLLNWSTEYLLIQKRRPPCARFTIASSSRPFRRLIPGTFPRPPFPLLHVPMPPTAKTSRRVRPSSALRHALFEEGLEIPCPDVLSDITTSAGVGWLDAPTNERSLTTWQEGAARGVKGSPHFYCGDSDAFCPSLEISKDGTGHLKVSANSDVLDAFLTDCFGGEGPSTHWCPKGSED